jgi:hypothetical protein
MNNEKVLFFAIKKNEKMPLNLKKKEKKNCAIKKGKKNSNERQTQVALSSSSHRNRVLLYRRAALLSDEFNCYSGHFAK